MKNILPILLFLFASQLVFAQQYDAYRIEALKEKGRQAIIWESINDMQTSYSETLGCWNLTAYEVTVLSNDKEMKVLYRLPSIIFLPINTRFYGNLAAEVISHRFSMEVLANPSDFEGPIQYYPEYLDGEVLDQMDFVIEAINKAQGAFVRKDFDGNMEIREYETFYRIKISSGSSIAYLKVEKKTSRVYDERHRQVKLPPQIENGFVEIKD